MPRDRAAEEQTDKGSSRKKTQVEIYGSRRNPLSLGSKHFASGRPENRCDTVFDLSREGAEVGGWRSFSNPEVFINPHPHWFSRKYIENTLLAPSVFNPNSLTVAIYATDMV